MTYTIDDIKDMFRALRLSGLIPILDEAIIDHDRKRDILNCRCLVKKAVYDPDTLELLNYQCVNCRKEIAINPNFQKNKK